MDETTPTMRDWRVTVTNRWPTVIINDVYLPEFATEVLESAVSLTTDDVRAILAVLTYVAEAEMMRN